MRNVYRILVRKLKERTSLRRPTHIKRDLMNDGVWKQTEFIWFGTESNGSFFNKIRDYPNICVTTVFSIRTLHKAVI
jgi:hypothetical protein